MMRSRENRRVSPFPRYEPSRGSTGWKRRFSRLFPFSRLRYLRGRKVISDSLKNGRERRGGEQSSIVLLMGFPLLSCLAGESSRFFLCVFPSFQGLNLGGVLRRCYRPRSFLLWGVCVCGGGGREKAFFINAKKFPPPGRRER